MSLEQVAEIEVLDLPGAPVNFQDAWTPRLTPAGRPFGGISIPSIRRSILASLIRLSRCPELGCPIYLSDRCWPTVSIRDWCSVRFSTYRPACAFRFGRPNWSVAIRRGVEPSSARPCDGRPAKSAQIKPLTWAELLAAGTIAHAGADTVRRPGLVTVP